MSSSSSSSFAATLIKEFVGFESGGLEEVTTTGSPTIKDTSPDPFTDAETYVVELDGTDSITSRQFAPLKDFGWGFYIRFDSLSPASDVDFMRSTTSSIRLRLKTDGNLAIIDANNVQAGVTVSTPFTVDTWHLVEIRWKKSASGDAEALVDGVKKVSVSGEDFLA